MKKTTAIRSLVVAGVLSVTMAASFQLYSQQQEIKDLQGEYKSLNESHEILMEENQGLKINLHESNNKIDGLQSQNEELQKRREELLQKVKDLQEQVPKVTKTAALPSRGSSPSGEWKTFMATYYDANYQSTGKNPGDSGYGQTASGAYVTKGVTIAVDPNVIPLGTWVMIKYPDGRTEKRQAQDTGSAIKGNKIDIYIPKATTTSGKHQVQVKILGKAA